MYIAVPLYRTNIQIHDKQMSNWWRKLKRFWITCHQSTASYTTFQWWKNSLNRSHKKWAVKWTVLPNVTKMFFFLCTRRKQTMYKKNKAINCRLWNQSLSLDELHCQVTHTYFISKCLGHLDHFKIRSDVSLNTHTFIGKCLMQTTYTWAQIDYVFHIENGKRKNKSPILM